MPARSPGSRAERHLAALLLAALLLLAGSLPALAERRVALVIGNAQYSRVAPLANPRQDGEAMVDMLRTLGFEVSSGFDLDRAQLRRTLAAFEAQLPGADVALFYFAGHGLRFGDEQYLVPVDSALTGAADLEGAVTLGQVRELLERQLRTSLILIDACRDNPLASELRREAAPIGTTRSAGAAVPPAIPSGVGTLIMFAADPGAVAYDGNDGHSPFTRALLQHLPTTGMEVTTVMSHVVASVVQATGGRQRPWQQASLLGPFQLRPLPGQRPAVDPEAAVWQLATTSGRAEDLEAYRRFFPDGRHAAEAAERLAALGPGRPVAPPTPAAVPAGLEIGRIAPVPAGLAPGLLLLSDVDFAGRRRPAPASAAVAELVAALRPLLAATPALRPVDAERGRQAALGALLGGFGRVEVPVTAALATGAEGAVVASRGGDPFAADADRNGRAALALLGDAGAGAGAGLVLALGSDAAGRAEALLLAAGDGRPLARLRWTAATAADPAAFATALAGLLPAAP